MTIPDMVHPLIFSQNPIIQKIAQDPHWTVSSIDKRPLNAKAVLAPYREFYNASFEKDWPLVTLPELDADPDLMAVNRAYRFRARTNRIIAIDVEPIASDELKAHMLQAPAHYTEWSKNGGIHSLIEIPETLITDENRYLFDELSVFKEPVPKDENGKDTRKAHFEVILNDHYMTFTKKMVLQKPVADFQNDPFARSYLENFLMQIVQLDAEKKKEREIAKAYKLGLVDSQITDEKRADIQKFINLTAFEEAKFNASQKNVADFAGDNSRYEITVANGLAYYVIRIHDMAKDTLQYRTLMMSLSDKDLTYAIYLLMQEAVPYRDKHDEIREDMPWLLYTSKNAYEYIKAKNAAKKKANAKTKKRAETDLNDAENTPHPNA